MSCLCPSLVYGVSWPCHSLTKFLFQLWWIPVIPTLSAWTTLRSSAPASLTPSEAPTEPLRVLAVVWPDLPDRPPPPPRTPTTLPRPPPMWVLNKPSANILFKYLTLHSSIFYISDCSVQTWLHNFWYWCPSYGQLRKWHPQDNWSRRRHHEEPPNEPLWNVDRSTHLPVCQGCLLSPNHHRIGNHRYPELEDPVLSLWQLSDWLPRSSRLPSVLQTRCGLLHELQQRWLQPRAAQWPHVQHLHRAEWPVLWCRPHN